MHKVTLAFPAVHQSNCRTCAATAESGRDRPRRQQNCAQVPRAKRRPVEMTCVGMLMVEGEKRDGSGKIARPYTRARGDTVGRMELVVKDYPGVGNVSSHCAPGKWATRCA